MARGVSKLRREMRAEGSRAHSASPSRCPSSFSPSVSSSSCLKTSSSSSPNKQSHLSSNSLVNISSPSTRVQRHQAPSSSPRRNERLGPSSAGRPLSRGDNAQSLCTPPVEFPSPTSKKALGQRKHSPRLNADVILSSSSSRLSSNKTTNCRERSKKTDNVGSGDGLKKKKNSETFSTVKKPALLAKPKHLRRLLSTATTTATRSSPPCTKALSKKASPLARGRKRKGHDGETCSPSRNSSRSSTVSSSVDNKAGEGRRNKREEVDRSSSQKERKKKKKKTDTERSSLKQGVPRPLHRVSQSGKRPCSASHHKRVKGGVPTSSRAVVRSRFLSAKTRNQVDRKKKRKGMNSGYVPEKKKAKAGNMGDRCSSPRFKSSLNGEAEPAARCGGGDDASAEGEKSQTSGLHTHREHTPNPVISSSSSGGGNTPRKRQKKEEQEGDLSRSSVNSRKEGCQRNGETILVRGGKKEIGKNRGVYEDEGSVVAGADDRGEIEESLKGRGFKTSSGKKRSGSNGVGIGQNRTSLKKAQVNKLASPAEKVERDEVSNIESAVEAAHDGRAGAKQSRGRRPPPHSAWVTMSSSDFSAHDEENTPSSSPVLSSSFSLKKISPRLCLSSPSLSSSSSSRRPPVKESASSKGHRVEPSSSASTLVRRESTDSSGDISSCSSGVNNLASDSPCCSPASSPLSSSSSFPPPPPPPLPVLNSRELSRGKKGSLGGGNSRGKHSEKASKSGGGAGGKRSEKGGKRGSPRLDPGACTADHGGLSSSTSGGKEGSSAGIASSSSPSFSASSSSTTLQGLHRTNHRHWQNNCLLLYEHVMAHTLEWPSLTAQWMNSYEPKRDGEIGQTVLVATHTSGGAHHPNYLLLIEVTLPVRPIPPSGMNYDQRQDYSGFEFGDEDTRKFTVTSRIPHEGECNRARFCPQAQSKVASKALDGSVYIFDISKFGPDVFHPSSPVFFGSSSSSSLSKSHSLTGKGSGGDGSKRGSDSDEETEDVAGMHASSAGPGDYMTDQAEVVLYGHSAEGWGLDWAPPSSGRSACVASASDDGLVCVWDVQAKPSSSKRIPPLHKLVGDSNMRPLQDVRWKTGEGEGEVLLAVGDDGYLSMWDLRASHLPVLRTQCSGTCLNALALNEHAPSVVATGGADQGVNIWDLREMKRPAHRLLRAHSEAVTCLKWSRHQKTVIASGSTDRLIRIYDLSLVGSEQESDEAEDGPPELLFVHGGHGGGISDFDWNPLKDVFIETPTLVSVSEDNMLQIWRPTRKAFKHEALSVFTESDDEDGECGRSVNSLEDG